MKTFKSSTAFFKAT